MIEVLLPVVVVVPLFSLLSVFSAIPTTVVSLSMGDKISLSVVVVVAVVVAAAAAVVVVVVVVVVVDIKAAVAMEGKTMDIRKITAAAAVATDDIGVDTGVKGWRRQWHAIPDMTLIFLPVYGSECRVWRVRTRAR